VTTDFPTLLDVAISLVYVFFIVSLFVSGIWEFINTVVRDRRAALLKQVLEKMFADPAFVQRLFKHPLVYGQIRERPPRLLERWFRGLLIRDYNEAGQVVSTPAYIAPETFSHFVLSLLDISHATPPPGTADAALTRLDAVIEQLALPPAAGAAPLTPFPNLDTLLRSLARDAVSEKNRVEALRKNLETWYSQYMDRVSGFFKQHSQEYIRYISLVIAVVLNLDAVHLTQRLFNDPVLRGTLVANARTTVAQLNDSLNRTDAQRVVVERSILERFRRDSVNLATAGGPATLKRLDSLKKHRDTELTAARRKTTTLQDSLRAQRDYLFAQRAELAQLPLGWHRLAAEVQPLTGGALVWYLLMTLLGWLLMAAAASFGAPFWFDLLVKLVNIRNVGKKPEAADTR
jgi:hypothetical protein